MFLFLQFWYLLISIIITVSYNLYYNITWREAEIKKKKGVKNSRTHINKPERETFRAINFYKMQYILKNYLKHIKTQAETITSFILNKYMLNQKLAIYLKQISAALNNPKARMKLYIMSFLIYKIQSKPNRIPLVPC